MCNSVHMLIKFLHMKSIFTLVNIHIFEKKSFFSFFPLFYVLVLCHKPKWICLFILRGQSSFGHWKTIKIRHLLTMFPQSYLNLEQRPWLGSSALQSITPRKYIWVAWIWNLIWHLSNVNLVYMTTSLWCIIAQQSPSKYWVKNAWKMLVLLVIN